MMAEARTRLLNPGPVTLTSRVRAALTRQDLCHREPEFSALQLDVRARILGDLGGIERVVALSGKHGGDGVAPH